MNFKLLLLLGLLGIGLQSTAQNCGLLDSVSYTIVNNGNGTSNYTFVGYFSTTSGGSKSVDISIYCGSHYFVTNDCVGTTTFQITKTYGPFNNVTNCTGTIFIDWIGKTNAVCGGSPCGGATGITPVPVSLVSFSAERDDGVARLNWKTASELNNDRFEIQRKLESEMEFKTIAQVSGAGNSNELIEYQYLDDINAVKGKISYRLKQVDYDNAFEYSDVACVKETTQKAIYIYPNPANASVTIHTHLDGFSFEVQNSIGRTVTEGKVEDSKTTIQTKVLPSGMYYIKVKGYNGLEVETKKLSIL